MFSLSSRTAADMKLIFKNRFCIYCVQIVYRSHAQIHHWNHPFYIKLILHHIVSHSESIFELKLNVSSSSLLDIMFFIRSQLLELWNIFKFQPIGRSECICSYIFWYFIYNFNFQYEKINHFNIFFCVCSSRRGRKLLWNGWRRWYWIRSTLKSTERRDRHDEGQVLHFCCCCSSHRLVFVSSFD